jgi:putative oxidoreductase
MQKFLRLEFIPVNPDFGLLVLRLWLGLTMLWLHGWGKLTHFSAAMGSFPDPLHIGSTTSLVLAVFAEVVCSVLLVVGLFTRLAAFFLVVTMAVACFIVNEGKLAGKAELAFIYLAAYVVLLLAGAGRYSVDKK